MGGASVWDAEGASVADDVGTDVEEAVVDDDGVVLEASAMHILLLQE